MIEGPLLPDGTPDYVSAMNVEWSKGVLPETNAVVALMQAFGPRILDDRVREQYFALLGTPEPPLDAQYLQPLEVFFASGSFSRQRVETLRGLNLVPFDAQAAPEYAGWVAGSGRALDLVVEAAQREHFYTPIVLLPGDVSVMSVPFSEQAFFRDAGKALAVRSMQRLSAGELDGACRDAVTILRLGRVVSRGPWLVSYLTGMAMHRLGCTAAEELLLSGKLDAAQVARFREEILRVPPLANPSRMLHWSERISEVQTIIRAGAGDDRIFDDLLGVPKSLQRGLDRNVALPILNEHFDKLESAMALPDRRERNLKLKELNADAQRLKWSPWNTFLSKAEFSETFGKRWTIHMSVSGDSLARAIDRSESCEQLLETAATIASFRANTGTYPASLNELVPEYLPALPLDLFASEPLRYSVQGENYLLYSVGPNGQDDRGLQSGDPGADELNADDIRFGRLDPRAKAN